MDVGVVIGLIRGGVESASGAWVGRARVFDEVSGPVWSCFSGPGAGPRVVIGDFCWYVAASFATRAIAFTMPR